MEVEGGWRPQCRITYFYLPSQVGPATPSREWKVQPHVMGQLVEIKLISLLVNWHVLILFFYFVCESRHSCVRIL